MSRALRIGTRGSPLALCQAEMVRAALGGAADLVPLRTAGDRVQDRPLSEIGGKALWTKEIDRRLLAGDIDLAVHSMKDVESERPEGIALAAALARADVRDRLIGLRSVAELNAGMTVGTSSPRRAAQVARLMPGVRFVPFRGNVATRLGRIERGEADATLLAAAGLDRLGMAGTGAPVETADMLPAPGQGIIGVEARTGDRHAMEAAAAIGDEPTLTALLAERAFARALGGSCHSPVAALAVGAGDGFRLTGEILTADGRRWRRGMRAFASHDAETAGAALAAELLADAPPELAALFSG